MASAILLFFCTNTDAAEEIASTLNPVGSGARATGMGGAFIGVADDATAASWNPAGLIQLEKPEISAVYSYFQREQDYNSGSHPEIGGKNTMDSEGLNYASLVFPFVLFNRNVTVSLNYQRLYEMDKDINYKYIWDDPNLQADEFVTFKQEGFLYSLSPAMAVQILPGFYLGATVNFWDDYFGKNGWDKTQDSYETGIIMGMFPSEKWVKREEKASFEGINYHFGFLWEITGSLTLGGVYKSEFDADVRKEKLHTEKTIINNGTPIETDIVPPGTVVHDELRMPPSYGLGMAYRHSDNWTIALDIYLTQWSRFVLREEDGDVINPLTGNSISEGKLKDTIQVRLGAEYLFIKDKYAVPVRFGLFYDPEPETGHLDDYYGFTFGTGYARGRMVLDVSYRYRTGNNISGDLAYIEDSSADLTQHVLMMSAIFYFGS